MANNSHDVISLALTQVGYREGYANGDWDNVEKYAAQVPGLAWVSEDHEPWCDVFASWALYENHALGPIKPSASVGNTAAQFQKLKRWTEYPVVGGIIDYGNGEHTGICTGYDKVYMYSVEGNTNTNGSPEGNGVYTKEHRRDSDYITGYGIPFYDEWCHSADPEWAGKWLGSGPEPAKPTTKRPYSLNALLNCIDKGETNQHIRIVETALGVANPDGKWDDEDTKLYQAWQEKCGYHGTDADGRPGLDSLTKLLAPHDWQVM